MADELKVSVRVTPDTSGFQPAMEAEVKRQNANHPIQIPVSLATDISAIRKAAEGIQQTLQNSIKPVSMPITLDDKAIKRAVEQTVNATAKSLKSISVDKWAEQQSAKVSSIYRKISDPDTGLKNDGNQLAITSRLVEVQTEIDRIASSSTQITASQRQLIDDMLNGASKLSSQLQKEEARAAKASVSQSKPTSDEKAYEANLKRILKLEEQLASEKSSSKSNVYKAQIQDLEAVNNKLLDAIASQKNFNQLQKEQYATRKSTEVSSGTTHDTKINESLISAQQNAQNAIASAMKLGGGYDTQALDAVKNKLAEIGNTKSTVTINDINQLNLLVEKLLGNIAYVKQEGLMPVNQAEIDSAVASFKELGRNWSALFSNSGLSNKYANVMKQLETASTVKEFKAAQTAVKAFKAEVVSAGKNTVSWSDRMAGAVKTLSRYWSVTRVFFAIKRVVGEMIQQATELDSKITDLQIASGKSRNEVKAMVKDYAAMGKELGTTATAMAEAADTFLRQGKSMTETNELIKNSMYLSKLGQIDAAEASTALTSSLNGYQMAAEEAIDVVDKLTAVDAVSASSAGGLAVSLAETATSAKQAGVSFDQLVGYIATVKTVTQDADESVGTFFRTLTARAQNIKAGNLYDPENAESLSDVETTLSGLGIALRDSDSEFRALSDVLDEVAGQWDNFTTVQQRAIAVAFAGTRQQEKF